MAGNRLQNFYAKVDAWASVVQRDVVCSGFDSTFCKIYNVGKSGWCKGLGCDDRTRVRTVVCLASVAAVAGQYLSQLSLSKRDPHVPLTSVPTGSVSEKII